MKKIKFTELVQMITNQQCHTIFADKRIGHWRVKFVGMAPFSALERKILSQIPEVIEFGYASKEGYRRCNGAFIRISKQASKIDVSYMKAAKDILEVERAKKRLKRLKDLAYQLLALKPNKRIEIYHVDILNGLVKNIKRG